MIDSEVRRWLESRQRVMIAAFLVGRTDSYRGEQIHINRYMIQLDIETHLSSFAFK